MGWQRMPDSTSPLFSPVRGLGALLLLLLVFAELPLLAKHLPVGPAGLITPRAVAAASAIAFLFHVLAVWPVIGTRGRAGATAVQGALFFLVGATFVFVSARAAGVGLGEVRSATLVLAATTLLAGILLARSAAGPGWDRLCAMAVLLVSAGLPLANYALNEFGGISGRLGYRLSPPLLVRRILLGHADADPVPFLMLCLLALAVLQGRRLLGRGKAAAMIVLLLAGTVRGEETRVAPLLGDAYVPGRPLPVLVTGTPTGVTPAVLVPGVAMVIGQSTPGGCILLLPAPEDLNLIHVRVAGTGGPGWEERGIDVRAVPFGWRHLVSFTGVGDEFLDQAQMRSIVLSRVHPGALSQDAAAPASAMGDLAIALLAADGVLDPDGILPPETVRSLEAAGVPVLTEASAVALDRLTADVSVVRRIWEEEETVLSAAGLFDLFPGREGPDPARSRTALFILLGFSLLFFAGVRFILRRRLNPVTAVVFALLAAGWTAFLALSVLPEPPDWKGQSITVREGERTVRLELLKAVCVCRAAGEGRMVLGPGAVPEITADRVIVPLKAHEARITVAERFSPPVVSGSPDVLFGPAGLRLPGRKAQAPAEFLKKHYPGGPGRPDPRALVLRKLIRLANPPQTEVGIRFPTPERAILSVLPVSE